jgi:hypothetical protein
MTTLSESPVEGSTYVITAEFLDIDGEAFTPTTCVWTLSAKNGTIINARSRVAVTVTGTTYDFVLSGEDLLYADGKDRRFLVEGTYNSTYGTGLPFREEAAFILINTVIDPA